MSMFKDYVYVYFQYITIYERGRGKKKAKNTQEKNGNDYIKHAN